MKRFPAIIVLCLLLAAAPPALARQPSPPDSTRRHGMESAREHTLESVEELTGGPLGLVFSAGYAVAGWQAMDFGSFTVAGFTRELLFAELALRHPLLNLGESLNLIRVPRIRIETNLGHTPRGQLDILVPAAARELPYLRASTTLHLLDLIYIRYRAEHFRTNIQIPRDINNAPRPVGLDQVNVDHHMSDLHLGLVFESEEEDFMFLFGLGGFRSEALYPGSVVTELEDTPVAALDETKFSNYGYYFQFGFAPFGVLRGVQTELLVKTGTHYGADLRLDYVRMVSDSWSLGILLEGNYYTTAGGLHADDGTTTHYWATLLASWSIF